jgi:hypothetical protein
MANAFYVIDEMFQRDPKGEFAVAFMSPDNFLEARTGKDGWGFVKMAVNNDTITKLFLRQKIKLVLIAYDVDNYLEVQKSMDTKRVESPVDKRGE